MKKEGSSKKTSSKDHGSLSEQLWRVPRRLLNTRATKESQERRQGRARGKKISGEDGGKPGEQL